MKKVLCAVLFILLVFTGCSIKGNQIKPLSKSIDTNVVIRHKNIDYTAELVYDGFQTKIIYTLPKSHGGLVLIKDKDGCKAELLGLNITSNDALFNDSSAIVLIDKVLNYVLANQDICDSKQYDEFLKLSGKINDEQFELVRYAAKPEIVSLSIPSQELTVTFNNK